MSESTAPTTESINPTGESLVPSESIDPIEESILVGPPSQVTSYHIHFDRPASFLVTNLSQEIAGWLAIPPPVAGLAPQFAIDGEAVVPDLYHRPDVEQRLREHHVIGWTLRLDPAATFRRERRTIEFSVRLADTLSYSRRYFKSRCLMPADHDSPLYFMHIPKTAGTALRQFTDFVFSEFPSMLVYGHAPGICPEHVAGSYRSFAKTRELFFGHFDFGLTRELSDKRPKVITVFRKPEELVRSYLRFNTEPVVEFLDNPLVRHVCGLGYGSPHGLVTARHMDQALRLIDQYFYVIQQNDLQQFADEVTTAFGLPHFGVPHINVTGAETDIVSSELPINLQYDTVLYEKCLQNSRSFIEFLDS